MPYICAIVFRTLLVPSLVLMAVAAQSTPLRVLATTTQLKCVLEEVGGSRLTVDLLIPGGSCPGHYDVRAGDMHRLARGAALFTHGYESFVPRLVAAVKPGPRVFRVEVSDSWMKPETHIAAARTVCRHLEKLDPAHTAEFRKRLSVTEATTRRVERELRESIRRHKIAGTPVASSDQQAAFLRWMGFRVVATYGRAEDFTPAAQHKVAQVSGKASVRLVVDNLQSGPDAGYLLAKSIGARRVTLSNFPGGFPKTGTWEACLRDNVRRVLASVKA